MAKGWDSVAEQAAARAAADARRQETYLPELRVNQNNPGPYVIRFLEQGPDVNSFRVHEYKEPQQGGGFYTRFATCLSEVHQDCPMCRAGMKSKIRGVYNVIQRNRPIFRKDGEGRAMKDGAGNYYIDGYADTVVVANVGSLTAEELRKADGQYQGLMSRDFHVAFSGNKFQSWSLAPAIDQQGNAMATQMSENDYALAAAKHDLDKYMAPPSAQEAAQIVAKYGGNSGASQPQQHAPGAPQGNQFLQGVPQQAMAAAGVNSFGLATAAQQPPQPVQQAPQQQPLPAQAPPVYMPPSIATPQQPQSQVGVPAQAAPPQQPPPVQQQARPPQQPAPPQPAQTQQFR